MPQGQQRLERMSNRWRSCFAIRYVHAGPSKSGSSHTDNTAQYQTYELQHSDTGLHGACARVTHPARPGLVMRPWPAGFGMGEDHAFMEVACEEVNLHPARWRCTCFERLAWHRGLHSYSAQVLCRRVCCLAVVPCLCQRCPAVRGCAAVCQILCQFAGVRPAP